MKEEEKDSGEDDVPEEWHLAATMAECADVNAMLAELGRRVSLLEEVRTALANARRRKLSRRIESTRDVTKQRKRAVLGKGLTTVHVRFS